jgi:hypothetical protein
MTFYNDDVTICVTVDHGPSQRCFSCTLAFVFASAGKTVTGMSSAAVSESRNGSSVHDTRQNRLHIGLGTRNGGTEGRRKVHKEELHDLYLSCINILFELFNQGSTWSRLSIVSIEA